MGLVRRADGRRGLAYAMAFLMLLGTVLTFGLPASAGHPPGTCLDVEPEIDSNPNGTLHTLTATLRVDNPTSCSSMEAPTRSVTMPVDVDFEIESGPTVTVNDDRTGPSGRTIVPANSNPSTSDMSCRIDPGTTSCMVAFTASATGTPATNVIRGWVGDSTADETEGRDETVSAGATLEPDDTDVVAKTWVPPVRGGLDCEPEQEANPSGTNHTVTCTARDENGGPRSGLEIDAEARGANDPEENNDTDQDEENTPSSPDYSCTTNAQGQCSFTMGPGGDSRTGSGDQRNTSNRAGTTTFRVWIDEDKQNPTFEGDGTEGRDETTQPGTKQEPDDTDVVEKLWGASNIDCTPETDTNPTGLQHVITCQTTDDANRRVSGTAVDVEATGANDPDASNTPGSPDFSCITGADGCVITHGVGGVGTTDDAGVTTYRAWVDFDGNDATQELDADETQIEGSDPNEPDNTDTVIKNWIGSRLDCLPESDTNPAESAHTVTCTARDVRGAAVATLNVDAEATGVNDPDNGDTPLTPDFSCTTGQDGTCTFTHGPGGRGTTAAFGKTTYRAWIDADNNNATNESDPTEARDEGPPAPSPSPTPSPAGSPTSSPSPTGSPSPQPTAPPGGRTEEPDSTDVIEKNWTAVPDRVTMAPEVDSGAVGSCNEFTVTAMGPGPSPSPVAGVVIDVEQRHELSGNTTANDEPDVSFCTPEEGPNRSAVDEGRGDLNESPDNLGTAGGETEVLTDSNGQVTFGIRVTPNSASNGTGEVLVTAFYENEDNDDPDAGDPQDSSRKTWTPPTGRTIACEPEQASNPVGTTHTVTCTVRNQRGEPARGEGVTFTEQGPGRFTSETQQDTDENGQVNATLTSDEPGDQTITATQTSDLQSEPDADECDKAADDPTGAPAGNCEDSVTKNWGSGRVVESGPCQGFAPGSENDTDGDGDNDLFVGTSGPDEINGTGEDDVICGLGGGDDIRGRGGADDLVGNAGGDTIAGGGGKDQVDGAHGRDNLDGDEGNDVVLGGADRDRLSGSSGNDTLRGGGGNDRLRGGSDKDVLRGARGDDELKGGSGRDNLDGGAGQDACSGGPGRDRLRRCE